MIRKVYVFVSKRRKSLLATAAAVAIIVHEGASWPSVVAAFSALGVELTPNRKND